MEKIEKIIDKISKILIYIAAGLMAVLTCVITIELVVRALGMPMTATTELTSILFPWIVGLSSLAIARDEEHIALVFFKDNLNSKHRTVLELIINTIVIAFSFIMVIASIKFSFNFAMDKMPVLRISKAFVYVSVSFVFFGVMIDSVMRVIKLFMAISKRS